MDEEIVGKVLTVLVAKDPNSMKSTPIETVEVTFEGFQGDKHSGWTKLSDGRTNFYPRGTTIRNNRQISLISKEETDLIASTLGIDQILPEWMGANLLISDIPEFSSLEPNSRLFFSSGVVLLITAENHPCMTLSKEIASNFPDRPELVGKIVAASKNLRGLVAVVELPGYIKKGDDVRVMHAHK